MKINFMPTSDLFDSLENNLPFDPLKLEKQLVWRFPHQMKHLQMTKEFSVKSYTFIPAPVMRFRQNMAYLIGIFLRLS